MKLQLFIIILILTMAVQGWAACAVDQNNEILQFNSRFAVGSMDLFETNLNQIRNEETAPLNFDRTSNDINLRNEICQDIAMLLQNPVAISDTTIQDDYSNQDVWKQLLENGFSRILTQKLDSSELGQISSETYLISGMIDDVNSNILSLEDNGESWDELRGTDFISEDIFNPPEGAITLKAN